MPFVGKLLKFLAREAAGELVRNCAEKVGQKAGERISELLERGRGAVKRKTIEKKKKKTRA